MLAQNSMDIVEKSSRVYKRYGGDRTQLGDGSEPICTFSKYIIFLGAVLYLRRDQKLLSRAIFHFFTLPPLTVSTSAFTARQTAGSLS